ncbi:MAG: single-stranded-DNA-specific exonuclease RecJ [Thermoleophilia bacterium]
MRSSRWHTAPIPYETIRTLANALGSSDIMATVLARRGYGDPEAAREFLLSDGVLHDPYIFPDMVAVRDRIHAAISSGETICIHGDYDVDGITSTALLANILKHLGAKVTCHLPNRFSEGYGIALETIDKIAAGGARLIIAVDCGIGARIQFERARELGVDAIVVDHHQPVAENLPQAPIISALLCDYPFKELAGVGLAFKVAQALVGDDGDERLPAVLQEQLDLVALGTVADVVPLVDENRTLVKRGLPQLARTRRPGLAALMKLSLVDPSNVNTGIIAFRLAPRINAAGRLEDPTLALELLMAEDEAVAARIAGELDALNRERQRIENRILAEAQEIVGALPDELQAARGYVLSSPDWHEGIIGIVASKMVELHKRPVIMIAANDALGKGSGRSIPAFDLHDALLQLESFLEAFGGHRAACGLTISVDQIPAFQKAFGLYASQVIDDGDIQPSRYVDALVSGRELTLDLAEELSRMEPFGMGNPAIELLAAGARLLGPRATRDGRHLQCQVESGGARSSAIGFGQGHLAEKIGSSPKWDVVFRLEQNEYKGSISPQLQLKELFPHAHDSPEDSAPCAASCDIDCGNRVGGDEFWRLSRQGEALPPGWTDKSARSRSGDDDLSGRLIDRRNHGGIHGLVTMLASCGENILLLTADVARRRNLVTEELSLARRSAASVRLASSRCSQHYLEETAAAIDNGEPGVMLVDFATVASFPALASRYEHVVFIDPPFNKAVFATVAAAAPAAFIHLFYCADEVQFTEKVLENEFHLRTPLTKVYRHLKAGNSNPLNETTAKLLLSGGRYIRQPGLVSRCLRVLEELALVEYVEADGGTIILLRETGDISLEDSSTYRQVDSFYKESSSFLSKSLNEKMV